MASNAQWMQGTVPANGNENQVRSEYWDGWKAVCITVVIALHVMRPPEMSVPGSLRWYANVIFPQFILFPVAIFLAMAGFFALRRSFELRFENVMEYYKRRLMRILPPI
jgi:peptidoglycan/LPS O-acetylase OafA/YrhL